MEASGFVAEAAGQRILRDDAETDLVADQHERGGNAFAGGDQGLACGGGGALGEDQGGQPQRQAIDQDRTARRLGGDRAGQIERRIDRLPSVGPAGAMLGDALAHLVVIGLRGGDIGPGRRQRLDQRLGMAALAGAGAAEDEREMGDRKRLHRRLGFAGRHPGRP